MDVATNKLASIKDCDVLVIGGGPAGSTAATLLAQKGYQVTLIEKEAHPRFHIGESLLPANLPLFEKLGVADEIKSIGTMKWAAEFESIYHNRTEVFEFTEAWDKSMPHSYEVERAVFDEILIRNAERKGANVIERCRVSDVFFPEDDDSVVVETKYDDGREQTWSTRFLLDASGRDTFLGNKFKTKKKNKKHNSTAVYGHFTGARRNEGKNQGNITISWFEHGWLWFIPLSNGKTSVGAVAWPYYLKTRKKPLSEFLMDTIALCPPLMDRLRDAKLVSDVTATGNYSYICDRTYGQKYLLLGDAFAFIDPVFSSGVMLAMNSAFVGAETVDVCLSQPKRAASALKSFDKQMRVGPKEYSWFIYRVTSPTLRAFFMNPRDLFRMKQAVLSVMAGDLFGKTPIWFSLFLFKSMYFGVSIFNLPRTIKAWRARRQNIRNVNIDGISI